MLQSLTVNIHIKENKNRWTLDSEAYEQLQLQIFVQISLYPSLSFRRFEEKILVCKAILYIFIKAICFSKISSMKHLLNFI